MAANLWFGEIQPHAYHARIMQLRISFESETLAQLEHRAVVEEYVAPHFYGTARAARIDEPMQ